MDEDEYRASTVFSDDLEVNEDDDRMSTVFSDQLLEYMMEGKVKKARLLITEDLAKMFDQTGTLLHYATNYNSKPLVKHLLNLGSEIDAVGISGWFGGHTPLMIAVKENYTECVRVLLKAGANIDMVDGYGESILQMIFKVDNFNSRVCSEIIEMIVQKLKSQISSTEALVDKLVEAGCAMHHMTRIKNLKLMKRLLNRGADINSEGRCDETALHAATTLNDFRLVKWLVNNGADVHAIDFMRTDPLTNAVHNANPIIVEFLLEHGADPNRKNVRTWTALEILFNSDKYNKEDKLDECAKILFQYGAVARESTIISDALDHKDTKRIGYLAAHLAILDMLGTVKIESIMRYDKEKHQKAFLEMKKYYCKCLDILKIIIFEKRTLFDLLIESQSKTRFQVRNELFVKKVEEVTAESDLKKLYPYYYDTLMKRITTAVRIVKLEDQAIPVICDVFEISYSQFYIFARQVVSYLTERDLIKLCEG